MATIGDTIYDNGLSTISGASGSSTLLLHIGSGAEPSTYAGVTGATLGNLASDGSDTGSGTTSGFTCSLGNGTSNGRSITVSAVTDGDVTGTGTCAWWALVNTTGSVFYASGTVTGSQTVTSGNTFSIGPIEINIADV